MDKLYRCIDKKKVNNSHAREAIYRVLIENRDKCLSVDDILQELEKSYYKNISLNTIYRHLNLFIACEIVVKIEDDYKKAYFSIVEDEPQTYVVCKKCNRVKKFNTNYAKDIDILNGNDYVIVHTKCQECN